MRMLRPLLSAAIAVSIHGATVHAADANPYDMLPRCPDDAFAGQMRPMATLRPDSRMTITGEVEGALFIDADGNATLNGVTIQQGEHSLRADELQLLQPADAQREVQVSGAVEYSNPQLIARGSTGRFTDEEAAFEGATFELPLLPARGSASNFIVNQQGVLRLNDVLYTTCPEEKPDWHLRADSVSIDTERSVGTARDARVVFFGVPLLRLPYISFPVGNARKTGLLFPSLGNTTRSGVHMSVPYYFNLAPQQDLTLTPTYYTSRGLDIGGEYRYLTRRGRGQVDGNLMPQDRKLDEMRNRVRIQSLTELPGRWRLNVDAENVSDARYFEDFAQGANGSSIAFLPRRLLLAYRGEHMDAGVLLRNFQTLDQELPQIDRPHTEAPRIYAQGDWTLPGSVPLSYGLDAEAVSFLHSNDVQGWRMNAAPRLGLDYTGAGYFVRPEAILQTTQYRLRDVPAGTDTSPQRTLPLLSFDTGLQFERASGSRGQRRMTLEPRLMYLYTPYREQSDLPVFDTGEPDLSWVELFRPNRYVGLDRVSDANQVSAGVTTQLYSSVNGTRYLSATIGQTYYFRTPRVHLPDEPPVSGSTSDLIAQVELQAFRNWSVSTGLQWDPGSDRTERAEMRFQYSPAARSVVNVGYRFQRDRMEQVEVSLAWPISPTWRAYGRSIYSLRDSQSIESFAGFEYSSCCWNLRALARDYVSRRSGERDRSYYVQLELKGLSNVGLAADAFLEKAIRGYSPSRGR